MRAGRSDDCLLAFISCTLPTHRLNNNSRRRRHQAGLHPIRGHRSVGHPPQRTARQPRLPAPPIRLSTRQQRRVPRAAASAAAAAAAAQQQQQQQQQQQRHLGGLLTQTPPLRVHRPSPLQLRPVPPQRSRRRVTSPSEIHPRNRPSPSALSMSRWAAVRCYPRLPSGSRSERIRTTSRRSSRLCVGSPCAAPALSA